MTWQDELRKLDEELAAGRLSADDYRVRRDQVLSSAVASGAPAPNPESAEATQMMPPISGPPVPQGGGGDDAGEKTQIVPGNNMPTGERTQAIQPEQGGWQAARPAGDGDRTQVVPGVQQPMPGPPPQQQGYPQQQQQAPLWNNAPQNPSPWDGPTFPPLAHGTEDWVKQGPEESSSSRKLLVILGVIVLVIALGVGSYFVFFNKTDTAGQQPPPPDTTSQQTPPPPTTTQRPKDDLEVAELPGSAEDHSNITTFDQAASANFLTEAEVKFYRSADADKSRLASSVTAEGVHALIFTTKASSASTAKKATDKLADQQLIYGMKKYTSPPVGVQVAQANRTKKVPAIIRAHYVHGSTIVRIQVNGNDLKQVTAVFKTVIAAELQELPADG